MIIVTNIRIYIPSYRLSLARTTWSTELPIINSINTSPPIDILGSVRGLRGVHNVCVSRFIRFD